MKHKQVNIKLWAPLAFTAALFLYASCNSEHHGHKQQDRIAGTWQAAPVTADGKRTDWPNPYPYSDRKALISYAVSNDENNFYITATTGDPATELKILRNGLVVWVDKSNNKHKTTSICFPSDNNHNPVQEIRIHELPQRIDEALANTNEFFLQGFKGCRGKFTLPQGDSCGIKVGIGLDEYDQLVWEAVIPFKTFYFKNQIDAHDRGKPIDICFDIQGLEHPNRQGENMRPNMGGFGIGVGGMGMGVGTGMGGRGYSGGIENEELYKSASFWKKVGIAYKQQ